MNSERLSVSQTIKKIQYLLFLSVIFISSCSIQNPSERDSELIQYVNPFIGTTRQGNQLPGPRCPFGMVQPNPINAGENRPPASNYIYGESDIFGIALTNMVGVGCSNFGSINLKPTMGEPSFESYSTKYSEETAEVGYYSVLLEKDGIKTEMTTTERAAVLKFHFPAGNANILFDLSRRIAPQDTSFMIKINDANEIEGYKTDGSFCSAGKDFLHRLYFVAKTNIPASASGVSNNKIADSTANLAWGEDIGAYFSYNFNEETEIELRYGISYVSIENARENLEKECDGKSFAQIREECQQKWENRLSVIEVEGSNEDYKKMFYTALYHTMSHPNILDDYNGQYPAMGSHEIKKVEAGKHRFTVFSLWDTYRALHPFFTLVYPDIQEQMAQSLMGMYYENGWLPQWELIGKETHVMVGDPASIVLADTYLKGIKFDNGDSILKAMLNNAENFYYAPQWGFEDVAHIRRSIVPYLKNNGWIPYDYKHKEGNRHWASVATTQEYNLADWNISQMAKDLGKKELETKYLERSMGYRNLFNPETGFMQQRWENGEWVEPFNPFAGRWPPRSPEDKVYDMSWSYSGGPGYCEGMAWHYNFFVPHDIKGLITLMGGGDEFVERLQTVFDSSYYEATNEPDLAFPFLFNYVKAEEWRTQKTIYELINNEYGTGTDGIPGNDDTGTMSSWLMFSMMGIYPDCPGSLDYQITTPVFDKVKIKLNPDYYSGKEFVITTQKDSDKSIYIKDKSLSGSEWKPYSISHNEIVKGGELHISLADDKD